MKNLIRRGTSPACTDRKKIAESCIDATSERRVMRLSPRPRSPYRSGPSSAGKIIFPISPAGLAGTTTARPHKINALLRESAQSALEEGIPFDVADGNASHAAPARGSMEGSAHRAARSTPAGRSRRMMRRNCERLTPRSGRAGRSPSDRRRLAVPRRSRPRGRARTRRLCGLGKVAGGDVPLR
jgi:hypothetical protein